MNEIVIRKINNRIKELIEAKEECLDWQLKNTNDDTELESMNASLNMAYGLEIKFLNDLKKHIEQ